MPEGSLTVNLQSLRQALDGVTGLAGSADSGFTGAAALAADAPTARVDALVGQLSGSISGALAFDTASGLTASIDLLETLRGALAAQPAQPLAAFGERLARAAGALEGDLVGQLEQALAAIGRISADLPADRTGVVGLLLEQILGVVASLGGPEAAQIEAWAAQVQAQHSALMPLIESIDEAADPTALALEIIRRALAGTLEVFGYDRAVKLLDFVETFPTRMLPSGLTAAVDAAFDGLAAAYDQAIAAAGADYVAFREQTVATYRLMQSLKLALRPVMTGLRRAATARILQPGALEALLRAELEAALAVPVNEVQKIDDPFNALLDRIDAAIDGIDLGSGREDVLGFFERPRATIEQADVPSLGDTVAAQTAAARDAVADAEQAVTDLQAQIQAFFAAQRDKLRTLAGTVGSFAADGSFQFAVEQDLRQTLAAAQQAVAGMTGQLTAFQASIDQYLAELRALLQPLVGQIATVTAEATAGIDAFTQFVADLDLPNLNQQLAGQVQALMDELGTIDFNLVVDPVLAEIEVNAEKLRSIDPSAMNDLLREALATALAVVLEIDFTVAISNPLEEQFATIKAVPAAAIGELQARYDEATALLDELRPDAFLEVLFEPFDVIDQAVGQIGIEALLEPLDELHRKHLVEPLDGLRPSVLLQPLAASFQNLTGALDGIDGAALIGPLAAPLDSLRATVAGIDLTGWIDQLSAAVAKVKADIGGLRPSGLLDPLIADFAALEAELDRFKPSVLFEPAVALAAPLLALLEDIQQEVVTALFEAFQEPLAVLDALEPERLLARIGAQLDELIGALEAVRLPARVNALKGRFFDLNAAIGTDEVRVSMTAELIDPQRHLGEVVAAYEDLMTTLRGLRQALALPDLDGLYQELRERLTAMLPPYARALLDPETFKRVMRLADPTRFLAELDTRFTAIKDKLIVIRPQDIAAELDAAYDELLAKVEAIDIEASLDTVAATIEQIQGIADSLRVDFVAADIDAAVAELRTVVEALDISRLFGELDALHAELADVVAAAKPSTVLAGLDAALDDVKAAIADIDPRTKLAEPLTTAWAAIDGALDGIDFTVILQPVVAKLDEIEAAFEAALAKVEAAFDGMLGAARSALAGGGSVSVSVG